MKEVQVTMYEANNGKQFKTREECLEYEKFLELSNNTKMIIDKVNEFLLDSDNYDAWYQSYINENSYYVCTDAHVSSMFSIELAINDTENTEIDEDFAIDYEKWNSFLEQFKIEYFTYVSVPNYYWSK